MSDHTIQIRDLMEMLKQHDPTAGVYCARGNERMVINKAIRGSHNSRNIAIQVHGDSVVSELGDECNDLESQLRQAKALLERFQHMQDAIGTSEELDDLDVKTLVDDVAAFL